MDNVLFAGLNESQISNFLDRAKAKRLSLKKSTYVFNEGETPEFLYILESGVVQVEKIGEEGKRTIVNRFYRENTIFGEVYLYIEGPYSYSCCVVEDASIICIPKAYFKDRTNIDDLKSIVNQNMLTILAKKAVSLNDKLFMISNSNLRKRLLKYFKDISDYSGNVELKLNREDLADYLGVTRPSLSRELMNMKKDGLIEIKKDFVRLI